MGWLRLMCSSGRIADARVAQRSRRHVYLQVAPYEVALDHDAAARASICRDPVACLRSCSFQRASPERGQQSSGPRGCERAKRIRVSRCSARRADVPRQRFWPRAATLRPLVKRHRAYWCEWTWVTERQGGGGVFVGEEERRGEWKRRVKVQSRAAV